MNKTRFIYWMAGVALCACESKEPPQAATQQAVAQAEDPVKPVEPPKLPAPPGDPGPVLMQFSETLPTQIFGAAATEKHIALALQSDTRDINLCTQTQLPVCFRGVGIIAERLNPNQTKAVVLYEADTQSGSRFDDVAATQDKFVFAIHDGRYVGDEVKTSLVVVNTDASVERTMALQTPDKHIVQTKLALWTENRVLACQAFVPTEGKPGIICEALDARTGKLSPVATILTSQPVRTLDIAATKDKALVTWIEAGTAKAAQLKNPNEILELGSATSMPPHVAAGLDAFAVIWQDDGAQSRVDRIPFDVSLKGMERKTIILNGIDHRSVNGLVATSKGYVFAFRHQNTQQMAIIAPDFERWDLIDNSTKWRMLSDYASLDIQEAHTGKVIWQTVESLF